MPSNRRAVFTLSVDCEGLWGMADNAAVIEGGAINQASLTEAYAVLRQTLERYQVKATAAFVSCFAVPQEALRDRIPLFERMAAANPAWFKHILSALKSGALAGWSGASFYRAMAAAGHEMAWHGTTHQSLADDASAETIALEMELMPQLFAELGAAPGSIVFPRNRVGHLDLLRRQGFDCYRAALPGGLRSRLLALANEWNVLDSRVHEQPVVAGGWHKSPAGHFLNWPSGIRRTVPPAVTVRRWTHMLDLAINCGGYVHMWFHPHNLITAPAMRQAFVEIIRHVGERAARGEIANLTMSEAKTIGRTAELHDEH